MYKLLTQWLSLAQRNRVVLQIVAPGDSYSWRAEAIDASGSTYGLMIGTDPEDCLDQLEYELQGRFEQPKR